MYRIDSIAMFEGSSDTWLLEAQFLGFLGRPVYATLLHLQSTGRTEIRPKRGRPTAADIVRPVLSLSFGGPPSVVQQEISQLLAGLGWGPEIVVAPGRPAAFLRSGIAT